MTQRARYAINDNEITEAFDMLVEVGKIDDDIAQMVADLALELAENRLKREDEACK